MRPGARGTRIGRGGERRMLVEFETPDALVEAARRLRSEGHDVVDAFTPCRVEGLDEALGLRRTRIPWIVLGAALLGAGLAYTLQWWISAVAYPLNVGGRPIHPGPAFIPVTFETAILAGSIAGFVAFFVAGGMPRLWDPRFEIEGFERATVDRYWLELRVGGRRVEPSRKGSGEEGVEGSGKKEVRGEVLTALGALRVVEVPRFDGEEGS